MTTIGGNAFASNQLATITIPETVNLIGYGVFSNNPLTSVTILEDSTRFYEVWEDIAFPANLKPD